MECKHGKTWFCKGNPQGDMVFAWGTMGNHGFQPQTMFCIGGKVKKHGFHKGNLEFVMFLEVCLCFVKVLL